jgi:hypothetical protein
VRITRVTDITVNRKNIAGTAGIDTIIVSTTIRIPVDTIIGIEEPGSVIWLKKRAQSRCMELTLRVSLLSCMGVTLSRCASLLGLERWTPGPFRPGASSKNCVNSELHLK